MASSKARSCGVCGAHRIPIAGTRYLASDLALFAELDAIVQSAQLSSAKAVSIALELESGSARWEPPEVVLERISPLLPGLYELWDPGEKYSRLLIPIRMLLAMVFARMRPENARHTKETSRPRPSRREPSTVTATIETMTVRRPPSYGEWPPAVSTIRHRDQAVCLRCAWISVGCPAGNAVSHHGITCKFYESGGDPVPPVRPQRPTGA